MQEGKKGLARLFVDDKMAPSGAKKPVAGEIMFDHIEIKDDLQRWKEHFLLPDDYTIIARFFDVGRWCWILIVESAAIPYSYAPNLPMPILRPHYGAMYDEHGNVIKVDLCDMKII